MTSFEKRKALVNELRSAHFPFGFQNNTGAQSEYIERYKEYKAQMEKPTSNARANNFSVNDPNNDTNYQSQFKERFPEHALSARDDPSKLKQSHANKNFVFGYDPTGYETNYKDDFIKKGIDRPKPINQKQPHIDFGGDSLTNFTSTYNQVHNKKDFDKNEPIDPQMIRKSNMMLGNDRSNFMTQNNATYTEKPIDIHYANQTSNLSHISLGADSKNYESENKANFLHKEAVSKPVDKARVLDFKSAHFQMGFPEKQQFKSEFQSQYDEKGIDFQKAKGNRESSLNFNMDGKNYFNTSYGGDYYQKNNDKNGSLKDVGRIDNVCIGFDDENNKYQTEAMSQYKDKKDEFEKSEKQKHISTLELGDTKGDYLTHNQDIHTDKFKDRQNNKLTEEELAQLKGVHFETGFQNRDFNISSGKYGVGEGSANILTKQQIAAMKNTNLAGGDENPFKGGTTYKASFLWKKGNEN